ncbi:MAG: 2-C-methyl-D-erythritol 2,4-cyclodiphosphate synthase [Clostridia bacterium]|nr:2-C-methyl-D-erythritol 2,4-cyclodiphosphate synthase [Clostridia bacterium]MBO4428444.1 2-C-methyl-D-erythritol 2,4-cyclodiphosphate synthase [Clostridia bacterium]
MSKLRIGHGYDVHRLVEGRKLILGGVEIENDKGLLGHSDADVLCHAVADALLGAAGERDIGYHFPDSDEKYKGISSLVLLGYVSDILKKKGAEISNVDATLVMQKPKVSGYIADMRKNVASALKIDVKDVNIKATTEENLGFTGRCEGISAHAVCLVIA